MPQKKKMGIEGMDIDRVQFYPIFWDKIFSHFSKNRVFSFYPIKWDKLRSRVILLETNISQESVHKIGEK